MKQIKFFVVVCALLMGLGFVACNDSGSQMSGGSFLMRVVDKEPYTFQFPTDAVKYVAQNNEIFVGSDLSLQDVVLIAWYYDVSKQPVNAATKSINVTVSGVQKLTSQTLLAADSGTLHETATINRIAVASSSLIDGFDFFDDQTLLVPLYFLAESDIRKHTFVLVCNSTELKADDVDLTFYLRHRSEEQKPSSLINIYKAFDISMALAAFRNATGRDPKKIKILANETSKNESNALEDAQKELRAYTVDYKPSK